MTKRMISMMLAIAVMLLLLYGCSTKEMPEGSESIATNSATQNTTAPSENEDKPDNNEENTAAEAGTSAGAEVMHELFDIEQLADISEFPDFVKKAIGDLRWCDDLGEDRQFRFVYNAYMKEVTQEDFETYIANLSANTPSDSEEGNIFAFYWDWGQIVGEYFLDSGTLDVTLAAK